YRRRSPVIHTAATADDTRRTHQLKLLISTGASSWGGDEIQNLVHEPVERQMIIVRFREYGARARAGEIQRAEVADFVDDHDPIHERARKHGAGCLVESNEPGARAQRLESACRQARLSGVGQVEYELRSSEQVPDLFLGETRG